VEFDFLRHVVGITGRVVADDDRGVELAEDGAGAIGERVDLFLGEVGAAVAERGERDQPVGETAMATRAATPNAERVTGWVIFMVNLKLKFEI
jgi:hypothetical protein